MKNDYVYVDVETQSRVPIKKGLKQYFNCPDFKILTAAIEDTKTNREYSMWHEDVGSSVAFYTLIRQLARKGRIFVAHNATFEYGAFLKVLGRETPRKWRCTMALAMACGLPPSLELCAAAMLIPLEKMHEGKRLINDYSIPNAQGEFNKCPPNDVKLFMRYCGLDKSICKAINECLPDFNDNVWFQYLTILMNNRGIPLDTVLLNRLIPAIQTLKDDKMYQGINTKSAQQLKRFCTDRGVNMPNYQKETIIEALQDAHLPHDVRDILEKRQLTNFTSVQKYTTAQKEMFNGRLYGQFKYYGAQTGRDTGLTFQAQNLPHSTQLGITMLPLVPHSHMLSKLNLKPSQIAKEGLRSIIATSAGFICVDLAGIELRVLHWLAGCQDSIKAFKTKKDLYKELASDIYDTPVAQIAKEQRNVGKTAVLSLGYGAGSVKFASMLMAENVTSPRTPYNIDEDIFKRLLSKNSSINDILRKCLTEKQKTKYLANLKFAVEIVQIYRRKYSNITKLWYDLDDLFKDVLSNPALFDCKSEKFTLKLSHIDLQVIVWRRLSFISIVLPSKRRLHFFMPRLVEDADGRVQIQYLKYRPSGQLKKSELAERFKKVKSVCVFNGIVYKKIDIWGGMIAQNITQAIARDVFFTGHLAAHKAGYHAIVRVHDELLVERTSPSQSKEELIQLMTQSIDWAPGLPLAAEGWEGCYYRKE